VNSPEPPDIVVCALIENGGFGADAAAPAALQVFKQYFKKQLGSSQVAATG
jgi:cell division protein FtsI/penicillin-binding protein 2